MRGWGGENFLGMKTVKGCVGVSLDIYTREEEHEKKEERTREDEPTVDSILLHRLLKRTALSVPFAEEEASSLFLVSSERVRMEEGPGSLRRLGGRDEREVSFSFLSPSSFQAHPFVPSRYPGHPNRSLHIYECVLLLTLLGFLSST